MTFQETVDYLYARLPMFSRIGPAALKKDITNTLRLCEALGQPQNSVRTVHIAGTNGKGSTSHMLAAVLQTAGYKTGLYTSPHLHDFRERIKVNGQMCEAQFVVDFTEKIRPLIDEIEPSFFEITVAMALEYFVWKQVDIAVIETGLGGRLDSTNVITPLLSVITNIGLDHTQLLGDTLEQIAAEKAGIIKPQVPVVIGETHPATRGVFTQQASLRNAPIVFADKERYIDEFSYNGHHLHVTVSDWRRNEKPSYTLDLAGIYQAANLLTVLETVHQLQALGWHISQVQVKEALAQVKKLTGLHGRWELVKKNPRVILDVAHNADGMKKMVAQLEFEQYSHLYIILGMVKDKDVAKVLELLPRHASYCFTRAQIPRAMDENELEAKAAALALKGEAYADVNTALQAVLARARPDDLVVVCGSVFLVAEVRI